MGACPHHRGRRHCQQVVGEQGHHRRSRSCPCSTCRLSRRSVATPSSSNKMIDRPKSKKQTTTGAVANGSSNNKPRHLHQIPSRAYMCVPPTNIVSPPDRESESLTPSNICPEESAASFDRDHPLPLPSPSRVIKIRDSTNNGGEDNENIENRAYEKREYNLATWRMYHRIMESRRYQEDLPILSPHVLAQIKEEATVAYLKPLSPSLSGAAGATSADTRVSDRNERAQFTTRHLINVLGRAHKIAGGGNSAGVYHPTAFSEIASSPQERGVFAMDM